MSALPRVLGVQAEGAQPLVHALDGDGSLELAVAETVADSIAVGHPRNFVKALQAARRNGGRFIAVSDAAILEGMRELARRAGVFGEPAAAATVAGVRAAVAGGILDHQAGVVIIVTGNGLKDTVTALTAVDGREDVPADEAAIEQVLGDA